jgi:hypothetical protein
VLSSKGYWQFRIITKRSCARNSSYKHLVGSKAKVVTTQSNDEVTLSGMLHHLTLSYLMESLVSQHEVVAIESCLYLY